MSDFMLLGILRMPIEADCGIVAFTQFRSAARSAADRIEQLTAERDKWKTAFDESCNAWQKQCEHEMDRANKAEAERDRLREALWAILACETPNANATVTRMASITKAALKGETP